MWQHPRLLSSRCVARKRCRPISKVLGLCKQTAQQDALGLPHPPTSQLSHCAGHHDWQFWGTGAGLLAADGLYLQQLVRLRQLNWKCRCPTVAAAAASQAQCCAA
jgi:hypothetical protein